MLSLKISEDDPEREAKELRDIAVDCLNRHLERAGGVRKTSAPISVRAFIDDRLVGGLVGNIIWNWLYADLVWVEEEFRGRDIGSEVMQAAEKRAREMKLTGIYLWTESWQAPAFYTKLGYTQFVEFRDFPPGHRRFGFCKYLA